MRIAFFSPLDMNLFVFRLSWMTALVAAGHEVLAVVPPGDYAGRFREHGIAEVPFPMRRGSLSPLRALRTERRLGRLLAGLRCDVVNAFTLQGVVLGAAAARRAGVPHVVCHVTGLGYLFTERGPRARVLRVATRLLARRAFRCARRVTFQNEDDLRELAALVPPGRATIIRGTGIDTGHFSPEAADAAVVARLRREAGIGPTDTVVTFVGRLLAHKGIVELVEAFRAAAAAHPQLVLLVVGWRDEGNPTVVTRAFLEQAAGSPRVRFLGKREEIRELLALTDIYALPSYREGTPRTVLEAMSMGKAVITTDVPGCRQTVEDGVSGLLVPRADAVALERAISLLAGDGELRRRLGAAGRARAERVFSDRVVVGEILRLHRGLDPGAGTDGTADPDDADERPWR